MRDFTYLKNWLDFPEPRPIILECLYSRSGMNVAIWDRDVKLFNVGGCGYDRIGTAIGRFLEAVYQDELNSSSAPSKYGARRDDAGVVHLDGACGQSCMMEIGSLIGLRIKVYDSHSGTLIHITRANVGV